MDLGCPLQYHEDKVWASGFVFDTFMEEEKIQYSTLVNLCRAMVDVTITHYGITI